MTTNGNVSSTWDEARQLGQLFMMGFDGTTINEQVRTLVQDHYVGSILLTAKNLESASQATQLVLDLQTLAKDAQHPAPLFIAIDQENGGVNSLYDEHNIRQFPSAMAIAATNDHKLARQVAKATALELKSCGINWILGPVLDVLMNARAQPIGVRSFGDDIQKVSSFGADYIKGYHDGAIVTCGKHFPTYGNLEFFGSPTDVPTITETIEEMTKTAFVPFKNAIKTGLDAMIVGGVAMSSTNLNVMHACLSEQICRDLLRDEMKFEGVVISECLEMEALSRNIGISGGTVMAFKAGCDLLLTCRSITVQEDAINGLRAGLDSGMIDRSRVDESYTRIMALKAKHLSWDIALNPPGSPHLNSLKTDHERLSATAYNASVIAVRDTARALPLTSVLSADDELLLLTPLVKPLPASAAFRQYAEDAREQSSSPRSNYTSDTSVMLGEKVFRDLGRGLSRRLKGKVLHASYTANGVRPQHETLIDRAKAVIVVTADAARNKYQSAFAKHISMLCRLAGDLKGQSRSKICVVVAVSSPFDFTSENAIGTYVCTYDFTETALQALVRRLCEGGKVPAVPNEVSLQVRRPSQARQQWLVEAFRKDRDMNALDILLQAARNYSKSAKRTLMHVKASTFLLNSDMTEEAHFVVRNSSTKELLGFCATYYYPADSAGYIGCIIVDPARRNQSVGHSLHDRAMRALVQRGSLTKFTLGARMPSVYLGIPKVDTSEHKRLRRWFANLGWNVGQAKPIRRMTIPYLQDWTPPEGLGQQLKLPGVKFDLVHGEEYAESVLGHVNEFATSEVRLMYSLALNNTEGCAVIRAKSEADGVIFGTILLYRAQSVLASYIPQVQGSQGLGGIGSPVMNDTEESQPLLAQGLILLGIRQLKKQGLASVLLDYVDDDELTASLQGIGLQITDSFEQPTGATSHWTAT